MLDELSSERKREYKEAFEMFDYKKDGFISINDYENVLKILKLDPSKFKSIIKEHEINGENMIQFEAFMTDINSKKNEKELISKEKDDNEDEILNAFKYFENEKEGKISTLEFKNILSSEEGEHLNEDEIDLLISIFDNEGYIDYTQFVNTLLKK